MLKNAVQEAKQSSKSRKFSQSIDLVINLQDVDLKRPENKIDDTVELPNPLKKVNKVCVLASGGVALQAKQAGADLVLDKAGVDKLAGDKKAAKKMAKSYDFFLAEGSVIPSVGKSMGFALGPRGKMPKPIPPGAPVDTLLDRYRRSIRIRTRDQPVIQCKVGEEGMPDDAITKNIEAVLDKVKSRLGKGAKNIKGFYIKTTMGKSKYVKMQ